jgi:ABC-type transport system involved in multi-copper enzyme maturation permease subunit
MSQTKALLWKEWNEVRLFLAIALFVFLGLPVIGGVEEIFVGRHFELSTAPWVFLLGGVLAVFVGVGTVVRDLNGRLEEFWRSRPVSVARWLAMKYFVGLAVVLASLAIPLCVEVAMTPTITFIGPNPRLMLAWSPFLWAALYSLSFAIACLIRRGAHAAMLSISMLLLVYFLPRVIPPLRYLDVSWVIEESRSPQTDRNGKLLAIYHRLPWTPWPIHYQAQQLEFVIGMIALCMIGLTIAVMAARRNWRIESGRRMIYWSIGGALLILFSSAAFQVASNLTVLQTVDLPPQFSVETLRNEGSNGVMRGHVWTREGKLVQNLLHVLRITPSGVQLGPEVKVDPSLNLWRPFWNPMLPNILYAETPDVEAGKNFPTLITVALGDGVAHAAVQSFPELTVSNQVAYPQWYGGLTMIWHDRLYLLGNKLMTFDLADPLKPRLLSVEALEKWSFGHSIQDWMLLRDQDEDVDAGKISLPPIPQLPRRQRLEMVAQSFPTDALLTGDLLIRMYNDHHITTYHLDQLTETEAVFRKSGRYDPTALDQLFGAQVNDTAAADGLLFESMGNSQLGGAHITVFDVTGPRPQPVAHFALPSETRLDKLCPLPDGRLLAVGQSRLYLLGPPPGRK